MYYSLIKNIIFDLGGVFLDVDYEKTKQAFISLGIVNFDAFYQQSFSNPLFSQLEKGLITPKAFYEQLRTSTAIMLSDQAIQHAWNAMLGSFRQKSIAILPQLKENFNLYLLSNTNAIHHEAFMQIHQQQFGNTNFDDHFHKAYYSHLMGERKPDMAAYETILQNHHLKAGETLFVDDTLKNIEGAQKAGIVTLHLQKETCIEKALKHFDDSTFNF